MDHASFEDEIYKCLSLNENYMLLDRSLKFVPMDYIDYRSAVQCPAIPWADLNYDLWWLWCFRLDSHTVECCYNVIQYNMILSTSLPWLSQDKHKFETTKDTLYLALTGKLWGVVCDDVGKNAS